MKKGTIVNKIEAYWWVPFLGITIGGLFYSLFAVEPPSNLFSNAMLLCSILAFIGWLTRKKPAKRAGFSDTDGEKDTNPSPD